MPSAPNSFVWYELMTTDTDAAEAFYREVVGWRSREFGQPDLPYTIMSAGETPVAGIMAIPEETRSAGGRPSWTGYIAVDDVDIAADRVRQAGGAVHRAPADIPNVGRFSVVSDPQGAIFALFKPSGDGGPPAPPMTPGHMGGTSSTPGTAQAPSTSTPASSAGPKRRPWTWARWALTSCSPQVARRSAAS